MKFEGGFPEMPELSEETRERIDGLTHATEAWTALERGEEPTPPENKDDAEHMIEALQFLKEKNARDYTIEKEQEQTGKVDAYIERLKAIQ